MNNNFEPKAIKEASHYLQDKLNLFKKGGAKPQEDNVYIIESKKDSVMKRLFGGFFKA
ncbi:hypothetical protein [Sulfurimonas sp.]